MRSTTAALLVGASLTSARLIQRQSNGTATGASNSTTVEDYFNSVCLPYASFSSPDWNTPCWQVQVITDQCTFGTEASWEYIDSNGTEGGSFDNPVLSAREQQVCACDSEFFQAIEGCVACANKHGLEGAVPNFASPAVLSFSSSYCAASTTATAGLVDSLDAAFSGAIQSDYPISTATTFTDPIGSRTEVSLYFTPSVTGSAAYVASAGTTGTPSTNTASAQSANPTSSGAAVKATGIAAAGVLGFAAMVAAL